jgi:predicted MFS family arabinose efflux permease
VLRAQQGGLALALVPMVLIAMNVVYSVAAYPFGRLADRMNQGTLLGLGLLILVGADLMLAYSDHGVWLWAGIAAWGLHMGMTQGLLSAMVAGTAPDDLRGTAFGFFNLVSGIALLIASALAGLLWDRYGASFTFYAGAAFSALALIVIVLRRPR